MGEQQTMEAMLRERGITQPQTLTSKLPEKAVLGAIACYDEQRDAKRQVTPGLLVCLLQQGGMPEYKGTPTRKTLLERERAYCEQIVAWLLKHFPDLTRGEQPHPAAIVAVIRLHHIHGKGALTAREHGARIRMAVEHWELRNSTTTGA